VPELVCRRDVYQPPGCWSSLDRAVDRDRHLIDARLRDTRDLVAAEAFFRSAWTVTGVMPDGLTTDGHDAYAHAVRRVFGDRVTHRTNRSPFSPHARMTQDVVASVEPTSQLRLKSGFTGHLGQGVSLSKGQDTRPPP
jgi:DDE domain